MFKYIPEREESKVESIPWLGFGKPVSYIIQQKVGIPLFISSIFGGHISIRLSSISQPADSSNQLPSICLLPDHSFPLYSQISLL